jgi:hypothetical protein
LLHNNIPCLRLPHINTLTLVVATFPRSHNVGASRNTQGKSTPDAIKSLVENDGDPNTEVAIRDTTFDDISVSTTHDVDTVGPIVGSIGGVGTMEGFLTTSDNKNDLGSLACLLASPLCGSNSIVAPRGSKVRVMPLIIAMDASICVTLAI